MALSRYVLTASVTVPAGTASTPTAGEPATGGAAGFGSASISAGYGVFPQTFIRGTTIMLDPTGPLYAALSASLRPYVQGQDDRGGRRCRTRPRRAPAPGLPVFRRIASSTEVHHRPSEQAIRPISALCCPKVNARRPQP
jgi:hypothetical protein